MIVEKLPVGTELCFDLSAVREQYAWSDAANNKFAQECISRLDAGEDPHTVQYSIVRERAPGLPWASYRGTPAVVSQYVELGQGEPPVAREMGRARVRHGVGGKKVSSSSSNVRPAENSLVSTGQHRVSSEDKVEALWRRAFDAETLVPLEQYAASSIFEDSSDR